MAVVFREGCKCPVCVVGSDWPVTESDSAVAGRRVDEDACAGPCTVYLGPAGPASRGDDDMVSPCAAVVVVPGPCVPSADMPVDRDKAPGMVDAGEPVPVKAARLPLPLASETLCLARDAASSVPSGTLSQVGRVVG